MRKKVTAVIFGIALIAGSLRLARIVLTDSDLLLTVLVGLVPAVVCVWIILKDNTDQRFLLRLFAAALSLRWLVAFLIYREHQQSFFGGDATTYDTVGLTLSRFWQGLEVNQPWLTNYINTRRPGWGMFYYVGGVYYVLGQNQLAVQLINGVLGAAACIAVYKIAQMVYPNQRVARTAALLTAFSPSMVLWSSQMLKDAPIVLCLCMCALYTLKLRRRFTAPRLLLLLISLFCLFSLRHYAFYIMFAAIATALLFMAKQFSPLRMLQGGVIVIVIGIALAYLGAAQVPQETFDLKRIQMSREWSGRVANSGFGGEIDITDPTAAAGFLPIGLLYVLFAPFPWMISNLRQLITLPELLAWWLLVPVLAKGYWFAARHRLKQSFAISVFTIGLTLVYALFQTNVGTAYRHRAQLYVFFFIFIGIGWELRREAKVRRRNQLALAQSGFAGQNIIVPGRLTGEPLSPGTS